MFHGHPISTSRIVRLPSAAADAQAFPRFSHPVLLVMMTPHFQLVEIVWLQQKMPFQGLAKSMQSCDKHAWAVNASGERHRVN
jgi:hypothetical protein